MSLSILIGLIGFGRISLGSLSCSGVGIVYSGDYTSVGTRVSKSTGGIGGLVFKFILDTLVTCRGGEIGFLPLSIDFSLSRLGVASCDTRDTSYGPSSAVVVFDFLFVEVEASEDKIFLFVVLGVDVEAKAS